MTEYSHEVLTNSEWLFQSHIKGFLKNEWFLNVWDMNHILILDKLDLVAIFCSHGIMYCYGHRITDYTNASGKSSITPIQYFNEMHGIAVSKIRNTIYMSGVQITFVLHGHWICLDVYRSFIRYYIYQLLSYSVDFKAPLPAALKLSE